LRESTPWLCGDRGVQTPARSRGMNRGSAEGDVGIEAGKGEGRGTGWGKCEPLGALQHTAVCEFEEGKRKAQGWWGYTKGASARAPAPSNCMRRPMTGRRI